MYVIECELMRGMCGEYVLKEVTLARSIRKRCVIILLHEMIKSPCSWFELKPKEQATNEWLTRYRHGHSFSYGRVSVHALRAQIEELVPRGSIMYTKGLEKSQFLTKTLKYPVCSIDEAPATATIEDDETCPFKHSTQYCSLQKAKFYANWLTRKYLHN